MKKLIVNADDLGISTDVDAVIEKCIQKGVISSSTLLANAPAFEDGIRIAKQYPQISIGVHLNIIQYSPLTNVEIFKKHRIVGDDGQFVVGAIYCVPIDEELKQAVFEEWDAQISKVENAGIKPTHCDSHQHTHTIPSLYDSLCRVLDKHRIPSVRRVMIPSIRLTMRIRKRPQITFDRSKQLAPPKRNVIYRRFKYIYNMYSAIKWNTSLKKSYKMTNSFFAFRDFYYDKDILHLGGKNAVVELMCHPGHKSYQSETDCLMRDLSWLPNDYVLISYKDL